MNVRSDKLMKEEDVYNLQVGLGESTLTHEEKHSFDILGYRVLENQLTGEQVAEALDTVLRLTDLPQLPVRNLRRGQTRELVNIVEAGGVVEDAMVLPEVINHLNEFIWGRQFRLIGSRAVLTDPESEIRLSQGGRGSDRRHAAYRCLGEGQFRCLMISCFIPLENVTLYVIPSSHKANLPHPYAEIDLESISPLVEVPVLRGGVVIYTESLSHAIKPSTGGTGKFLLYHYGTSYMVNWPGCDPSPELHERTAFNADKAHLLLEPYYHPLGTYLKKEN